MFGFVRMLLATTAGSHQESIPEGSIPWTTELARLRSILNTLPSDFDKTSFLRTYSGGLIGLGLIDFGRLDDRISRLYRSVDFNSFDPGAFFPLFKKHVVPAECGMTSYFYIKLLQSVGFKAYQYTFGFKEAPHERCVHSVGLVEILFEGTKRLIVQDPYLNLTYRTRTGDPIDFFEFLSTIRRRQYSLIVTDSPPVTTWLLVPDVALYDPHLTDECKRLMWSALRQPNGQVRTKLAITRDYATLMQSPCDNVEKAFLAALCDHGYPEEPFLYTYTLRTSDVVGNSDHEWVQSKIDSILR